MSALAQDMEVRILQQPSNMAAADYNHQQPPHHPPFPKFWSVLHLFLVSPNHNKLLKDPHSVCLLLSVYYLTLPSILTHTDFRLWPSFCLRLTLIPALPPIFCLCLARALLHPDCACGLHFGFVCQFAKDTLCLSPLNLSTACKTWQNTLRYHGCNRRESANCYFSIGVFIRRAPADIERNGCSNLSTHCCRVTGAPNVSPASCEFSHAPAKTRYIFWESIWLKGILAAVLTLLSGSNRYYWPTKNRSIY